jgi:hypothetical protein
LLNYQCPQCGYDPEVTCECPICNASCKAKIFQPHDSNKTKKAEAHRKRQAAREKNKLRRITAASYNVIPDTHLGRALAGANHNALAALPQGARDRLGITATTVTTGFSGSSNGGAQTGRDPTATFTAPETINLPPSVLAANQVLEAESSRMDLKLSRRFCTCPSGSRHRHNNRALLQLQMQTSLR